MTGDDELVARAKRGDGDAWRALYRAHAGRLLVWLSTRPSSDSSVSAEDLASQSWLTAAERIHTFEGTSSEFAGWLFGIARKHGGNVRRRGLRRNTQPADLSGHQTLGALPAVTGPETTYAAQDWVVRAWPACRPASATSSAAGTWSGSTSRRRPQRSGSRRRRSGWRTTGGCAGCGSRSTCRWPTSGCRRKSVELTVVTTRTAPGRGAARGRAPAARSSAGWPGRRRRSSPAPGPGSSHRRR